MIGVEQLMEPCVAQCPPFLLSGMAALSLTSLSFGVAEKVGLVVSVWRSAFGLPLRPGESSLFYVSEGRGRGLVGSLCGSPFDVVRSGVMEVPLP